MPQIWALLGFRFHPASVNRARHRRDVIANGQYILLRRATYDRIGTHEAVRAEVAEDLALAQETAASGLRVWFAFALSTCAFCAAPRPTTDFFTCAGEYSCVAMFACWAARRITPRAWLSTTAERTFLP